MTTILQIPLLLLCMKVNYNSKSNHKFFEFKKGNTGITNMHKSTGDKIRIPDGWVMTAR